MTEEFEFFEEEPTNITNFIHDEFGNHHFEQTKATRKKFSVCLNKNSKIVAAGRGAIFGTDFYISELIVAKDERSHNHGSNTLRKIEEYAEKSSCIAIFVDTYDYQAPDFYLKQGYKQIGKIENYRNGHDRIFFKKEMTE